MRRIQPNGSQPWQREHSKDFDVYRTETCDSSAAVRMKWLELKNTITKQNLKAPEATLDNNRIEDRDWIYDYPDKRQVQLGSNIPIAILRCVENIMPIAYHC